MNSEKQTIRVALADDHTMFRKGVVSILRQTEDIEVVAEASNGIELLDALACLSAPPDVCLLDVNMPGMNGYDTLVAIKARYPQTRAIALTMMDHEAIIIRMIRAGVNGYLLKENEPEELAVAIRAVLVTDFHRTELIAGKIINMTLKGIEPHHFRLSEKEQEFLKLCITDLSYKEIAVAMGTTTRTVQGYRDAMFDRLKIKSRTGLALYAIKTGLVEI